MNKQKAKAPQTQLTGLYKAESIRDVAELVNATVSDTVASALASDVEYRIHQVVEEAARFMRHAKRTTLTTSDIDQALRVLNIEPLYGHFPHNPPTFRRALPFPQLPAAGPVYFVEDEEIDFERVIREDKITLPKGVNWTAHWLAVEGVQPLIPENPPAFPKEQDLEPSLSKISASPSKSNNTNPGFPPTPPGSDRPSPVQTARKQTQQQQQQVKQVLSRELQLYYNRLTTALLSTNNSNSKDDSFTKRAAALSSLRVDAGLQPLLPYLVRWVAEGVVNTLRGGGQAESDGRTLSTLLDVICAILDNPTLFVEPYLHQLLPPILSTLLHSALPQTYATHLRTISAQTLSHLLTQHSTTYPSLSPRIMKTLLLALISPGKSKGTREGAIRGLMGVGKEAIRKGLIEGGGAKVVGSECMPGENSAVVDAAMAAFRMIQQPSIRPVRLDPNSDEDAKAIIQLQEMLGRFFADRVSGDGVWARGVLGGTGDS